VGKKSVTVRLPEALVTRLQAAADTGVDAYALSVTKIIERGADLALQELESKKPKSRPATAKKKR
jgi:hypothetical protein